MKLLLDANISHRLVSLLADLFPGTSHVREHNLQKTDDETVWNFARQHQFVIVSKDSDFHQRSFLFGFPPKVVWLRLGNCSTKTIEKLLRTYQDEIREFCDDAEKSFLIIP